MSKIEVVENLRLKSNRDKVMESDGYKKSIEANERAAELPPGFEMAASDENLVRVSKAGISRCTLLLDWALIRKDWGKSSSDTWALLLGLLAAAGTLASKMDGLTDEHILHIINKSRYSVDPDADLDELLADIKKDLG